jgi:hypothetical protein
MKDETPHACHSGLGPESRFWYRSIGVDKVGRGEGKIR